MLLIGNKYKVETDSNNFILKQIQEPKKKGEDEQELEDDIPKEKGWRTIGFFYDFRELLHFMVDNEVKGVGLSDLKKVASKQEILHTLINGMKIITPAQFHIKPEENPSLLT